MFWTQKAVEFREWTTKVRKQRVQRLESLIFRRMLNLEEAKDVLLDMWQVLEGTPIPLDAENKTTTKIRVKNLKDLFIDGIEGTLEDNARNFVFESLADYIDSRPGTKFANNGFRNLTYTFRTGHTKDTVADELMDIKDGKW